MAKKIQKITEERNVPDDIVENAATPDAMPDANTSLKIRPHPYWIRRWRKRFWSRKQPPLQIRSRLTAIR